MPIQKDRSKDIPAQKGSMKGYSVSDAEKLIAVVKHYSPISEKKDGCFKRGTEVCLFLFLIVRLFILVMSAKKG